MGLSKLRGFAGPAVFLAAFLALVPGGLANWLTGTTFPWEQCKQNWTTSIYTAELDSYYRPRNARGWIVCWRIIVKDQRACRAASGFPNNKTRCCDTDLNKFKFYPSPNCRTPTGQAVDGLIINGRPSSAYTWDDFRSKNGSWTMKITPLRLTPATAHGAQVCIKLKPPCETLQKFAFNGRVIEWNLYDVKRDNYECCPAGLTRVPGRSVRPLWNRPRPPPSPPRPPRWPGAGSG